MCYESWYDCSQPKKPGGITFSKTKPVPLSLYCSLLSVWEQCYYQPRRRRCLIQSMRSGRHVCETQTWGLLFYLAPHIIKLDDQFSLVQLLSHVRLFVTPWTTAHQASLIITNSQGLFKLMSTELVMPSNHLILCHLPLLPPSIFPSIRVFSNESVLCIRCPKNWNFSFSISPANEYSGLLSFRKNWLDLLAV